MASKTLSVTAVAATLIFAAGGAFAGETGTKSEQPVADTVITTKVKTELARDDETKARQINVTTKNGIVKLSGAVDSATAKQKAEADARLVEGVVSVDNQLTVKR